MKSHHDPAMLALLHEHAISNMEWPETEEEIDAAMTETKVATDYKPYTDAERAARIGAVMEKVNVKLHPATGQQFLLFGSDAGSSPPAPASRALSLFEIVKRAYCAVHDRYSSDRVIADPDMDARFIQECWRLGAQASQFDLNHVLMNARKRSFLGKTDGARKYQVAPAVMDQYLFACEFAARMIQEQAFSEKQAKITIDHILCEPALAGGFEEIARSIAPGFSSLDYRWALFALRKAKSRRRAGSMPELAFEWLGRLDSIRIGNLTPIEGFVWVRTEHTQVYIGHCQNLKKLIDRLLEVRIEQVLNDLPLFHSQKGEALELGVSECPRSSVTSREPFKNNLVTHCNPCLNVRQWQTTRSTRKEDSNGQERRSCGAA